MEQRTQTQSRGERERVCGEKTRLINNVSVRERNQESSKPFFLRPLLSVCLRLIFFFYFFFYFYNIYFLATVRAWYNMTLLYEQNTMTHPNPHPNSLLLYASLTILLEYCLKFAFSISLLLPRLWLG